MPSKFNFVATGGLLSFLVFGCLFSRPSVADEGMFPVSRVKQIDLAKEGMNLSPEQIFSSDQVCQIDGICRVNGCTGSFVSPKGLIITNHHCAYRAIQSSSTADQDYLTNGFHAENLKQEIPAKGYTVRITESFRDCSAEVLSVVTKNMSALDRNKAVEKQRKKIEAAAETANPAIRAEVSEMFIGETYVLFEYTYIKDVRLVFAPPASVGNFGGEIDNWEWPRHTGDFSFMRAYVAPDGTSSEYSPNNVPYQPKKHLQVSAAGVEEGDFVFLLGYPGKTSRHKTASFLRFERDVRLPAVVDLYQQQMQIMTEEGDKDRTVQIKHAARMRSLANVEKRSRGQLKGLKRKGLAEVRAEKEAQLQAFIESDPSRKKKYGSILKDIESVYNEAESTFKMEFNITEIIRASRLMGLAFTIVDSAHERSKTDLERETPFMERNLDQTNKQALLSLADLDLATDQRIIRLMLERMSDAEEFDSDVDSWIELADLDFDLEDDNSESESDELDEALEEEAIMEIERMVSETVLRDTETAERLLNASLSELIDLNDHLVNLALEGYLYVLEVRELTKKREGKLNRLYGELIEVKKQFAAQQFVPDANATLRLTYGHVKSYSPNDAVLMKPITTLRGVLEKTTGEEPFITPERVLDAARNENFGPFRNQQLDSVPVAVLYDTDTTGGNSGSPIMNGDGELVGVNFDRAFEATINDFAWNESYSRSIGVDIRYVLWITGIVYEAQNLTDEMGVDISNH